MNGLFIDRNICIQSNILRNLLKNCYFINGTAYAGKSTMVSLLAEKYDGICCKENYHMDLLALAEPIFQPNLCYFDTMSGWQEFIGRTPEEYDAWITNTAWEAAQLELIQLIRLSTQGKKIFVDTNIPLDILRQITNYHHAAILLSPQSMAVDRFFDREDPEKKFLLEQIQEAPDPIAAMENFRSCIAKINSPEHYREFAESGFHTYLRDENSTIDDALNDLEIHFLLKEI